MKSFKEKMEALNIKGSKEWEAKAQFRKDNPWVLYSVKIANRIRAKIGPEKELYQAKLAEVLNVSREQVSKILDGNKNLTLETIYKISKTLNIELITFPRYKFHYSLGRKPANKKAKIKVNYK